MTNHIEKLSNAYTITLGDQLMPGTGAYGVGAVAVVMPDENGARTWLNEIAEDAASLERGSPDIICVGDPWMFMRRAAGEGLAGIEGANASAFPERFMFMVRVEEAGAELPTVMASITQNGWDVCVTRTGLKHLNHCDVLHWQRFDIVDRVTGLWGQRCPFRQWDHGDTFFELCSDGNLVLLANVPLLGDWNSTEGAFAFFTTEEDATHYHHHHLADGGNGIYTLARAPQGAIGSLGPKPVSDLRARLKELADINPFAAWCVNPNGHREDDVEVWNSQ